MNVYLHNSIHDMSNFSCDFKVERCPCRLNIVRVRGNSLVNLLIGVSITL